jgi:hypothetical protein
MAIPSRMMTLVSRAEQRISVTSKQKPQIRRLPLTLAFMLLIAGCTSQARPNSDDGDLTPLISPTFTAKYTGKWKTLAGKCPMLTGSSARELGLAPETSPNSYSDSVAGLLTQCTWDGKTGPTIITIDIMRLDNEKGTAEQKAAKETQNKWDQYLRGEFLIKFKDDFDLGNESHIGIHRDQSHVIFLLQSSNVAIKIIHEASNGGIANSNESLMAYRATMRGLAADVLDDLR